VVAVAGSPTLAEVTLELQDATYATPSFMNATGNGANKWTTLDYQ